MSDYGSTTDEPVPETEPDSISSGDAFGHVDVSTEELAAQEYEDAHRQDVDNATHHDRVDEGRLHSRSEGDRSGTGGS